jgi:hypothetical protein
MNLQVGQSDSFSITDGNGGYNAYASNTNILSVAGG